MRDSLRGGRYCVAVEYCYAGGRSYFLGGNEEGNGGHFVQEVCTISVEFVRDCEHGFAVGCDLKGRKKRLAKESAYFKAVRWFDEWVKN